MKDRQRLLRSLPSVNEILMKEPLRQWLSEHPRVRVLKAVRQSLDELRNRILKGEVQDFDYNELLQNIRDRLHHLCTPSLRRVINATGIVIHTNLGRAPLPVKALNRIIEVSKGYSNLEYNLFKGARGKRYTHVRELIKELTSAEDALVVNNNAAAVLLCLSALASGREVIVSRGELVEIGGSFRIPDVMRQSGAILKEVGTTNKTHLRDYERAIGEDTALLLKVHQSNYRIVGFTEEVSIEELVGLGRQKHIPVMFDLGSGCFVDLTPFGLHGEPVVSEVIKKGTDIVTFSGDKLLGGSQAGIIIGRAELIERIASHPLTRAVRVDKLTLAALEAVLYLYLEPERAIEEIPVLRMLSERPEKIKKRALRLLRNLRKIQTVEAEVVEEHSQAGGGSLPGITMPTYVVAVRINKKDPSHLEQALRASEPPVIARIKDDRLLLDARTLTDEEVTELTAIFKRIVPSLCK